MLLNSRKVNLCLVGLDSGMKVFIKDSDVDLQPGIRCGFFNQFFDNFVIREDGTLNGMVDMSKEAMFSR